MPLAYSHSAPSLSLSLSLHPYLPQASLFQSRATTTTAATHTFERPAEIESRRRMRATRSRVCRPRGERETFFRGITFIALPSYVPRYYPLINCQRWRRRRRKKKEKGRRKEDRRRDRFRRAVCACAWTGPSRAECQFRTFL